MDCWLVHNGVPFSTVFGEQTTLTALEKAAMSIVFSTFEGHEFDWDSMEFKRNERVR